MGRQVTEKEFFEKIAPLNVALEVKESELQFSCGLSHQYKTLFRLKHSWKLVGYEEYGRYYLFEEGENKEA